MRRIVAGLVAKLVAKIDIGPLRDLQIVKPLAGIVTDLIGSGCAGLCP